MNKALLLLALLAGAASAQAPHGGPPPAALDACANGSPGSACVFRAPHGEVRGSCRQVPEGFACVPSGAAGFGAGRPQPAGQPPAGGRPMESFEDGPRGPIGAAPFGADIAATGPSAQPVRSRIPDTNQGTCFDARGRIDCPAPGMPFHGQDAQYRGAQPDYRVADGIVHDRVTGLIWQQAHNPRRLDWPSAQQACATLSLSGHRDWRLPSIRELFSIADFRGSVGRRPYLDEVFEIQPPDASILANDPFASTHSTDMMGQTWSATRYSGDHWGRPGVEGAFFMNFLDGHIKQAPTAAGRSALFYRCVRGASWGENAFVDNGDGTVTDQASQLTWQQQDDGRPRDWQQALAYCEGLELAGHRDWRLPNVKELQSIVDYRRHDPAIDPRLFGQRDPAGWFWSSTTHGDNIRQADYVCFGKCTSADGVDVHGAGAQRSDPKQRSGQQAAFQGGQRDEIRVENYVRCVR